MKFFRYFPNCTSNSNFPVWIWIKYLFSFPLITWSDNSNSKDIWYLTDFKYHVVSVYIKAEPPNLRCSLVIFMLSTDLSFFRNVTVSSTSLKSTTLCRTKELWDHNYALTLLNYHSLTEGLSWSWSYGSWIYNYLCNQCLLPLMLLVRIPLRRRVLDIMW